MSHHFLSKEVEPLQRSHSLRTSLNISKCYMRLASHLTILECDDIQDRAIGREEGVEGKAKIRFLKLFREVLEVETMIL